MTTTTTRDLTDPVTGQDPLLAALAAARKRREQADRDLRLLIAHGRHATWPRPYRLADLADAAGLSISGVRTACTHTHIEHIREITGTAALGPWSWQITVQAVAALLNHSAHNSPT